ncbi:MAG: hypothetical protein NW241_16795 [Bacteroidia bacterium]|nr:hypothetical protein [Bacteroidia bacterium]
MLTIPRIFWFNLILLLAGTVLVVLVVRSGTNTLRPGGSGLESLLGALGYTALLWMQALANAIYGWRIQDKQADLALLCFRMAWLSGGIAAGGCLALWI